jgi:hypothetical protein
MPRRRGIITSSAYEEDETMTHEVVQDTPYYLTGPQQGRPPEGTFKAGTRVKLLQDGGSYARVQSEDGITAWAAKSDLKEL